MRELDKNKVYDLSELTSEQWDLLKTILNKNSLIKFKYDSLEDNFRDGFKTIYFNSESNWVLQHNNDVNEPTSNAKELFYTLENVQVDCSELTKECIKEMADVFDKTGYKYINRNKNLALKVENDCNFLYLEEDKEIVVGIVDNNKTTITYEKFMELFGYKEKSEEFKNLVEVLNEELTAEAYKGTEYEVKYIAEKPKQYQIGIDTFERCESNMTKEEILACVKFGIDKYTWRNKGQDLEDLEKIIAYANWGIKQLKQQ